MRKIILAIILSSILILNACNSTVATESDIDIGPSGINLDQMENGRWAISFGIALSKHSNIKSLKDITGVKVNFKNMVNPIKEMKITKMSDLFSFEALNQLEPLNFPLTLTKKDHLLIVLITNIEPTNLMIQNIELEYGEGEVLILNEVEEIMIRLLNY